MTSTLGLFRRESLAAKRLPFEGPPIFDDNKVARYAALLLPSVSLILFVTVFATSLPRHEDVQGWITTSEGVATVRALPTRPGVVTKIYASDGKLVRVGERIADVQTGMTLASSDMRPTDLRQDLIRSQQNILTTQIAIENRRFIAKERAIRGHLGNVTRDLVLLAKEQGIQAGVLEKKRKRFAGITRLAARGSVTGHDEEQERQALAEAQIHFIDLEQRIAAAKAAIAQATDELDINGIEHESSLNELRKSDALLGDALVQSEDESGYSITAPVAGRVTSVLAREGYYTDGTQPLLSIVPTGARMVAELYVPSSASGFLSVGQAIKVMYDAFPYQRFGAQSATIRTISQSAYLPTESSAPFRIEQPVYIVWAELSDESVQAYGQLSPIRPGMTFHANIILENRPLYRWLLEPIYAVSKRS